MAQNRHNKASTSQNKGSNFGKIFSVAVEDFVTYDSVVFYPGDYLNIIIGPNGTGKSTLVAAIVLGMGGNPKLLSRSTNIQDYIKNGKNLAKISIGLYTNKKKKKLFSRFFNTRGKSSWQIDGMDVDVKLYLSKVAEFNIQIGNLCQFLPQDRVQDFAKMGPQELLENTQSSVCSPDVAENFQNLKQLRLEQKNQNKNLAENKKALQENVQRNEALKNDIKNLRTKNIMLEQHGICLKKKVWMEFEELYIRYKETEEDLKKAKENEKNALAVMQPFSERSKQIGQISKQYEDSIKKEFDGYKEQQTAIESMDEKFYSLESGLFQAKREFVNVKSSAAERYLELEKADNIHNLLLQDLKNMISETGSEIEKNTKIAGLDAKIGHLKTKTQELLDKRRNISQRIEMELKPQVLACNQKILAMENTADLKLDLLRSNYDHVFRAVLWLRNNTHSFQGKVYEPMILELNVMDNKNAKYFENLIPIRDLISFTCERREDMTVLFRKFRNEMNLNVNIVHSEASTSVKYRPSIPISALRQYGFVAYLIDLLEGPVPILNFLCRMCRLHAVPVGNDQSFQMSEQLPKEINLFFTPNHRFSINVSKYSGERSSMCIEISGKQLLSIGIDTKKLEEQKRILNDIIRKTDKYKNERTTIEDQIKVIEENHKELLDEKQKLNDKFSALDVCKQKLHRHTAKIKQLKNTVIDVESETQKFKMKAHKFVADMRQLNQVQINAMKSYSKSLHNYERMQEKFQIFKRCNLELENQIKDAQDGIDRARKYVSKITEVLERCKLKCKDKQQTANRMTDGKKPSAKDFPYKNQFEQLPTTLDELVAFADELQGRIDCINIDNKNILEDYETRKLEIARLKQVIENYGSEQGQLEERLKDLHNHWYPAISEVVNVINANFSQFMSSMGFAGEVELIRNEERDYDEYGIQIRVKYRNQEKLQALDRFVQSGGERAVAIATYTLSLQHISNVPFRCVDEINQGMDPRNERKIFEMLVDQTAQPDKCQYFFVTPKLLPNLKYNDLIAVHIVHNGKFVDDPAAFEMTRVS